nr:uncharacterized protein LOC113826844 [Penaeus vannamei]
MSDAENLGQRGRNQYCSKLRKNRASHKNSNNSGNSNVSSYNCNYNNKQRYNDNKENNSSTNIYNINNNNNRNSSSNDNISSDNYNYNNNKKSNNSSNINKCSRRVWELQQAGEKSVTLHCAPNGNYEPLQCEDGWCYCIDPATATPYGSRLPEGVMDRLDCYNKTLVGAQYLRRCESEYHAHMELYDLMEFKGVQGPSTLLECDADGSYSGKQCEKGSCRCYDKYKNIIAGLAGSGCQCARDLWMNQQMNINIEISCQVDSGSYKSIQTRGQYSVLTGFAPGPSGIPISRREARMRSGEEMPKWKQTK